MSERDDNDMASAGALTWVVTGASQGFGRAIAAEALARGDSVVASVRETSSIGDLQAQHPERLTVVSADLREPGAVERIAAVAEARFGAPDVLVNNAGRAIVGAAEEVTIDELRELMEVNFFAAAALTRALLPGMRRRGSGTIIQVSSQGGRLSYAGVGTYSATKFALEGWSEALAAEIAPFGIRLTLVEPSRFRTGFNTPHSLGMTLEMDDYADVVGPIRADLAGSDGVQEGDPVRAAVILADLARADRVPLRLPLGAEAVERLTDAYIGGLASVRSLSSLSRSADYPEAAASARAM